MWNEYEHTSEERAEFFKKLIHQLEDEIVELKNENYHLRAELRNCIRNPEDAYREDFQSYLK